MNNTIQKEGLSKCPLCDFQCEHEIDINAHSLFFHGINLPTCSTHLREKEYAKEVYCLDLYKRLKEVTRRRELTSSESVQYFLAVSKLANSNDVGKKIKYDETIYEIGLEIFDIHKDAGWVKSLLDDVERQDEEELNKLYGLVSKW